MSHLTNNCHCAAIFFSSLISQLRKNTFTGRISTTQEDPSEIGVTQLLLHNWCKCAKYCFSKLWIWNCGASDALLI